MLPVAKARFSARSDTICTSGFVDGVMFAHNQCEKAYIRTDSALEALDQGRSATSTTVLAGKSYAGLLVGRLIVAIFCFIL